MPNSESSASKRASASESNEQTLFLCAGSDCFKKQRPAFNDLRSSAIDAGLQLCMVKCQGSCVGPTAVVNTTKGPRWFEALDSPKAQTELVDFATASIAGPAKPSKALRKRELQGKRKKKAAKKLAKQLG